MTPSRPFLDPSLRSVCPELAREDDARYERLSDIEKVRLNLSQSLDMFARDRAALRHDVKERWRITREMRKGLTRPEVWRTFDDIARVSLRFYVGSRALVRKFAADLAEIEARGDLQAAE